MPASVFALYFNRYGLPAITGALSCPCTLISHNPSPHSTLPSSSSSVPGQLASSPK